ncbi:thioesterase [Parasulfuritortus cantonensis]|uniref:Thioesterase n=1 Tax=Parasulfuritortus cantonensis TaxID=2528202 RepID=A0A4R1BDT1_9PROT|nr:alpha/beta fold hydrolase [Parasulfuritortus cantonensis]TCJ15223.1 thioesterase [Parasulfuritortus cantonensis]
MKPAVFCLPHAGGNASFFARWQAVFGEGLDIVPQDYPGRGARAGEAPARSLEELVVGMAAGIIGRLAPGVSFALLGHSMGATVAWEVARYLEATGGAKPRRLFLSSRDSPAFARVQVDAHADDAALCRALCELGSLAPSLLAQPRFLKPHLAALRADLALLNGHGPASMTLPMPLCDAVVLYGRNDPSVTQTGLQDWSRFVSGRCELRSFDGGHFYTDSALPALADLVSTPTWFAR